MRLSERFSPTAEQIEKLISQYPLALVVSTKGDSQIATPLPLLLKRNPDDEYLLGHFARGNPQLDIVKQQSDALVVFMGPQGYISPSWFKDRSQAPTWNYACVQYEVSIELLDSIDHADFATDTLTKTMEESNPHEWRPSELGERHSTLIGAVVAFKAYIRSTRAKFKLGQNERLDVLKDAIDGLEASDQLQLSQWMRDMNRERIYANI